MKLLQIHKAYTPPFTVCLTSSHLQVPRNAGQHIDIARMDGTPATPASDKGAHPKNEGCVMEDPVEMDDEWMVYSGKSYSIG